MYCEDWDVGDIFPAYITMEERKGYGGVRKSITKYDLEGNKLEVFESINSAARSMGRPNNNSIGECVRGKRITALGFVWKYTG